MRKKLFNPFIYIAGAQALLVGLGAMLLTAIISIFSNSRFNGILDYHKVYVPFKTYIPFVEQCIILVCMTVVFYLAGRLFSRSAIRLIDVAGTMALARWPMIFPALLGFLLTTPVNSPKDITAAVIVVGFAALPFVIWMVALMYNAFSVSCNIKGRTATVTFIAALIIAEAAAYFLCYLVYHNAPSFHQ